MFTIYKYTCPSLRNYIGITMYPEVRMKQHRQKEHLFNDVTKFALAIRRFGFESFDYSVLETVKTLDEACDREVYWIKFYDSLENGYNIAGGGRIPQNKVHAERVVNDIRHMLTQSIKTQAEIAVFFGVSESYVSSIKNGKLRGNKKTLREPRFRKGSQVPNSKLSEETAKIIREKLASGVSRREIQTEFNISKTLVQLVATNQIWTHVEANYEYRKKDTNGNAVLDREKVSNLKRDIKIGTFTRVELAEKYGISVPTVDQIKAGKTWKDVE